MQLTKEDIWHRRYGHLGVQNLRKLAKEELVDGFDYNSLQDVKFRKPCLEGKHQRRKFPINGGKLSDELLGLVHSVWKNDCEVLKWRSILPDIH